MRHWTSLISGLLVRRAYGEDAHNDSLFTPFGHLVDAASASGGEALTPLSWVAMASGTVQCCSCSCVLNRASSKPSCVTFCEDGETVHRSLDCSAADFSLSFSFPQAAKQYIRRKRYLEEAAVLNFSMSWCSRRSPRFDDHSFAFLRVFMRFGLQNTLFLCPLCSSCARHGAAGGGW